MSRLFILTLLVAVLLAVPVMAADLSKDSLLSTETKLTADGTAHVSLTISLEGPTESAITIPFNTKPDKLSTEANFEPFSCKEASDTDYAYALSCDISALAGRRGSFKVEFETANAVVKSGLQSSYKEELIVPVPFEWRTVTSKLVLPEGAALAGLPNPVYGSNSTDGRTIFVLWVRENVRGGELITSSLNYEDFGSNVNLAMFYGIIAVLAVLAVGGFVYRRKLSPQMVLPVLRPDEKIVMEKLLAHRGLVHQKILVRESLYSKAKVSKVLKSLHERGVVRLERVGRSNQVFLNSNFDKKSPNRSGNSKKAQNDSD